MNGIKNPFICQNVLPHTKWQNAAKAGRTNSRTNCQQNKIAISRGWAYGFTLTLLPPQMLPQICESWVKSYLMQVCKPCHYALVEAVEPFKLHPMSMAYIYEVLSAVSGCGWAYGFKLSLLPPQMLFQICESLVKFYLMQVCNHASLHFYWVIRTFQTAFPIHGISIWGVWAPSQNVDGHMASHSHRYHHRHLPRFMKVAWNPIFC